VLWAAVPETAVDEDGDPPGREDQVGPYGPIGQRDRVVDAEAVAARVKLGA
jgi:hypothetical protein